MSLRKRNLFVVLALAVVAALLPSQASAAGSVTTIATGLDSPRGIAFYKDKLLVGEAGHGGTTCFPVPIAGGQACTGPSSQISWVNTHTGAHTPLVAGLYSISLGEEGSLGVSGLSVSEGRILAQIGGTPREDPTDLAEDQAGRLILVRTNGTWKTISKVGTIDFDYTLPFTEPTPGVFSPGTQEHDSNPYGVLATDGGAYVADAGSNTLDWVSKNGKTKILIHDLWRDQDPKHAFPTDAVPTCVVQTERGLYVGELSGRLLKVHGKSFDPVTLKDSQGNSLLTHVTGCTSDGENVYFVNMFGAGAPFTPPPDSQFFIGNVVQWNVESGKASVLAPGLQLPNMDTIGPDGNLYVTAGAVCPSPFAPPGCTGTVLKIALPHESGDED